MPRVDPPEHVEEATNEVLALEAMRCTGKPTKFLLRCMVEDYLLSFGDAGGNEMIRAALGRRWMDRDLHYAVSRASLTLLAKAAVGIVLSQQLGTEDARDALLATNSVSKRAIRATGPRKWAWEAWRADRPETSTRVIDDRQMKFCFTGGQEIR